eukprot:6310684-Alexandrium_andersonii.AAC.1
MFVDLDVEPGYDSRPTPDLPTLKSHNVLWSFRNQCAATTDEQLLGHGICLGLPESYPGNAMSQYKRRSQFHLSGPARGTPS